MKNIRYIFFCATPIILLIIIFISYKSSKNNAYDEGAYKPSVMYNDILYSTTPEHPSSFNIAKEELKQVGVIEEVIGNALPTKNFQASIHSDLLGCAVYASDTYPNHLIIFDTSGKRYVYVSTSNNN